MEALARRLKEVDPGQADQPLTITLGQLADEKYLPYKEQGKKRSIKDDRRILHNRLLPEFGKDLLVRRLSGEKIARYEARRIGEVSAYTVANELAVLRHMLRLANKWGYLDRVPLIELPKKPEGRQRYLSKDEIPRLIAACARSQNRYLDCIVTLAINTGMRKGEIVGLEWGRVDLEADDGFMAKVTLYKTKNGKPRSVPLNHAATQALLALEPDPQHRQGLLFPNGDGRPLSIRNAFDTAVKRAGLEGFRFHDLRHTAASHMVMRGRSLKDVQEILGHSDFRMTLKYAHLSPAHLRGAVEALDGLTPLPGVAQPLDKMSHRMAHRAKMTPLEVPVKT